jgi:hypothetical protein
MCAIRTALYREEKIRNATLRPLDDAVQTEPLKCRYTKSGICANIAGFCLCAQANFALPSSHDAQNKKKRCTTRLTDSPVNWPR